jgi:ADP-heptose:LPS heptosyltransferase
VVVFRYDKIGDMIVTTPLFRAIKLSRPSAHITLVCSQYNRGVVEGLDEIDRIVVYDQNASLREKCGFALALRELRPSATFVMSPDEDGLILAWLSGARRRAGAIMSYRLLARFLAPLLLTDYLVVDRTRLNRAQDRSFHLAEVALKLAERLGYQRPADIGYVLPARPQEALWAAQWTGGAHLPGKPIILHVGATWQRCGIAPSAIHTLVNRLYTAFPQYPIFVTAGPGDRENLEVLRADFNQALSTAPTVLASPTLYPRALLFSDLSFAQWSELIACACVVVAPDTGAVHLASARRRPVVAVYAPERFNRMSSMFGPWGVPFEAIPGGAAEELIPRIEKATRSLIGG